MIGKLKGIIDTISEDHIIIDVNGVGYVVFCSRLTISQVENQKTQVSLLIETHVREDHIHLYGFASFEEKNLFLQLTKVNGVGNKLAIAMLSALSPTQIITAIHAGDKAVLTSAPGVGAKLAARLITELKDKLDKSLSLSSQNIFGSQANAPRDNTTDAISALVNLGYNRSDAYMAVNKALSSRDNPDIDELIKYSLKELAH